MYKCYRQTPDPFIQNPLLFKKENAISNESHGEGATYSNPSLQNFQEILVNINNDI